MIAVEWVVVMLIAFFIFPRAALLVFAGMFITQHTGLHLYGPETVSDIEFVAEFVVRVLFSIGIVVGIFLDLVEHAVVLLSD